MIILPILTHPIHPIILLLLPHPLPLPPLLPILLLILRYFLLLLLRFAFLLYLRFAIHFVHLAFPTQSLPPLSPA